MLARSDCSSCFHRAQGAFSLPPLLLMSPPSSTLPQRGRRTHPRTSRLARQTWHGRPRFTPCHPVQPASGANSTLLSFPVHSECRVLALGCSGFRFPTDQLLSSQSCTIVPLGGCSTTCHNAPSSRLFLAGHCFTPQRGGPWDSTSPSLFSWRKKATVTESSAWVLLMGYRRGGSLV